MDKFIEAVRRCIDSTFVYGSVWDKKVNFGPLYSGKGIIRIHRVSRSISARTMGWYYTLAIAPTS
jgi:succinate-semialdehyde dehydrogenase/glutarate-semialdehyde dehydrogenase